MKNRIINIIICSLVCLVACLTSCKEEDQILSTSYMFKPKMVTNYPALEGLNQIRLIWYEVNNAESYTIQISFDEQFSEIYHEETVTSLSYLTPYLPYASNIYIRMRTNASKEEFNSIWAEFSLATDERDIPDILNDIDQTTIRETEVEISWVVDTDNYPVDSISVEKIDEVNGNTVEKQIILTEEESLLGKYKLTNLSPATNYKVTLCNSNVESLFDKPYNSVSFKTAGAGDGDIVITSGMDLSGLLIQNESNSDIVSGQKYYIQDEGIYAIDGYEFTKGFQITGAPGKDIILEITSPFLPNGVAGKVAFNNVKITGESLIISNDENDGKDYTWEGLELNGCTITGMPGIMTINGSDGNMKKVNSVFVTNCLFDGMTGGSILRNDKHNPKDNLLVDIEAFTITNSTIKDSYEFTILLLQDNYAYSGGDIVFVMRNVTVFESCGRNRMIQMNRMAEATLVYIDHCLFSNVENTRDGTYMLYETCLCGDATTEYYENYITNELPETTRKGVGAESLEVSQGELFVDHSNGDLTIKDPNSIVITNEIGDPRWWK